MTARQSVGHRLAVRGDDGIALVMAVAIAALVAVILVVVVSVAIFENGSSGRDRQRSVAVMSAEGQVDQLTAQIAAGSVASVPCGPSSSAGSVKSDSLHSAVTVTYYTPATPTTPAQEIPTTSCAAIRAGTLQAGSAKVTVTTDTNAIAGQAPARRTVEELVTLTPSWGTAYDKAIYGQSSVTVSGNTMVSGNQGYDADVYSNGNFACTSNETYQGTVTVLGSASMNTSCKVLGDVIAKGGITGLNGHPTIGGKAESSQGDIALNGIYITGTGAARAKLTASGDACSVAGTCVSGATGLTDPAPVPFPVIPASSTSGFVSQGFTNQVTKNSCTASDPQSPASWLATNGPTLPADTVLFTTCRFDVPNSVNQFKLAHNVAIYAMGGFNLSNSMTFISTNTSSSRNLYFIQPYDATATHPCYDTYGVYMNNRVTIDSSVNDLIYTPCNVYKANNGDHFGQVYGGGNVVFNNNTNLRYVPVGVWPLVITNPTITSYAVDIDYKRELLN